MGKVIQGDYPPAPCLSIRILRCDFILARFLFEKTTTGMRPYAFSTSKDFVHLSFLGVEGCHKILRGTSLLAPLAYRAAKR